MPRITSNPIPSYLPPSGKLGEELTKHAKERCRHYFLYLFTVKALVDVLNSSGNSYKYHNVVLIKASHQTDTGYRETRSDFDDFDCNDANIVNTFVTKIRKTDAAHFCNLGVTPTFLSSIQGQMSSPVVAKLWENLEIVMGNTR